MFIDVEQWFERIWWQGTLDQLLHRGQSQTDLSGEDPPLESQDSETTSFLSRLLFRGALLCPVLVPDLVSSFCPKDFMCTVSLRYGLSEAYKVLQTIRGALLIRVIMFLKKLVGWKRKYTKIYLRKLFINKILGPFTWLG